MSKSGATKQAKKERNRLVAALAKKDIRIPRKNMTVKQQIVLLGKVNK